MLEEFGEVTSGAVLKDQIVIVLGLNEMFEVHYILMLYFLEDGQFVQQVLLPFVTVSLEVLFGHDLDRVLDSVLAEN